MSDMTFAEPVDALAPKAGELWVTAGIEPVVVLVRKVRSHGWGVVVVPVSFDVDAATSAALVVTGSRSPFRVPVAVYVSMTASLTLLSLAGRLVVPAPESGLLGITADTSGVSVGTAAPCNGHCYDSARWRLYHQMVAADHLYRY